MNDRIGIIVPVEAKPHLFEAAVDFGVKRVELNGWNADLYTPALAESIRNDAGRLGIKITAFWAGWPRAEDVAGFYQRARYAWDRSA